MRKPSLIKAINIDMDAVASRPQAFEVTDSDFVPVAESYTCRQLTGNREWWLLRHCNKPRTTNGGRRRLPAASKEVKVVVAPDRDQCRRGSLSRVHSNDPGRTNRECFRTDTGTALSRGGYYPSGHTTKLNPTNYDGGEPHDRAQCRPRPVLDGRRLLRRVIPDNEVNLCVSRTSWFAI